MTGSAAVLIGLAQVLALIPGTSRAGITMTAARMLGYERTEASRFAMLLGVPVILAAGGWDGYTIWRAGDVQMGLDALLAAGVAFATAYLSVSLLMAWLRRSTFTPFVLYRVIVGGVLLYSIYYA
jgi:undecaprenyl-diphosphatase